MATIFPATAAFEHPNEILVASSTGEMSTLWSGMSLHASMDAISSWSLEIPYREPRLEMLRPLTFPDVSIYLGGQQVTRGWLHTLDAKLEQKEATLTVQGYGRPGVLAQCNKRTDEYPLQYDFKTLRQITEDIIEGFDIALDYRAPEGEPFEETVTVNPGEPLLSLLFRLARQRETIIADLPDGTLTFYQFDASAGTLSPPQYTVGKSPIYKAEASYKGEAFFSHVIGLKPLSESDIDIDGLAYTVVNPFCSSGVLRPHSFQLPDVYGTDLERLVRINTCRMLGSACVIKLFASSWYAAPSTLWRPGMVLELDKEPSLYIEGYGFPFLIRDVVFKRSGNTAEAELSLVLLATFNDKLPLRVPWQRLVSTQINSGAARSVQVL